MKLTKVQKKLLDAFYRERKRKTLEMIKVTDLCALADVSHSSFYKYYTDVYDFNRFQEGLLYSEMVIARVRAEGVENVSRSMTDFIWQNYAWYRPSEVFVFMENLYRYNREGLQEFEIADELDDRSAVAMCVAVETQIIAYVGTAYYMKKKSLTETDYRLLDELWRNGMGVLKKYLSVRKPSKEQGENERRDFLQMLAEENRRTIVRCEEMENEDAKT